MLKKFNHTHLTISQFISAVLLIILFTFQFMPFWTFTSTGQAFVVRTEDAVKPEDKNKEKDAEAKAGEGEKEEVGNEQEAEEENSENEPETAIQVIGDGKSKAKSVSINSYVWFPYNNADLETYFSEIMPPEEKQKRFDGAIQEANTSSYINGYLKSSSLATLFEKVVKSADTNGVIFKAENDEIMRLEAEIKPTVDAIKKDTETKINEVNEYYKNQIEPLEEQITPQIEEVENRYSEEIEKLDKPEWAEEEKAKQKAEKEAAKQAEIDALKLPITTLEAQQNAEIKALTEAQNTQITTLRQPITDLQNYINTTKEELAVEFSKIIESEKYATAISTYTKEGYLNEIYKKTIEDMRKNDIDIIKINDEYRTNLGIENTIVEAITDTFTNKGLEISDISAIPSLLKSNNATFNNKIDSVVTKSVAININKVVKVPVILFLIFVAAIAFVCMSIFIKRDINIIASILVFICAVVCYLQYYSHFSFSYGVNVKAHLVICVMIMIASAVSMLLKLLLHIKERKE